MLGTETATAALRVCNATSRLTSSFSLFFPGSPYLFSAYCTSQWRSYLAVLTTIRCAGASDAESFHLEMRSFLNELRCPHVQLTKDLSSLIETNNRLLLVGACIL